MQAPIAKPWSCWNEYKETGAQLTAVLGSEILNWQLVSLWRPHKIRALEMPDLSAGYALPKATWHCLYIPIHTHETITLVVVHFSNLIKQTGKKPGWYLGKRLPRNRYVLDEVILVWFFFLKDAIYAENRGVVKTFLG